MAGGAAFGGPPSSVPNQNNAAYRAVPQPNSRLGIRQQAGIVKAINKSKLIVRRRYMGKEENLKFKMTPKTKKTGKVKKGTNVLVYYTINNNGKSVATRVIAEPWRG